MPGRAVVTALRRVWDSSGWRPEHAKLLWAQIADRDRNREAGLTDAEHLRSAAQWLARAQDVCRDGGVAGRYRLRGGWTSSYPETTGYIIPTFQLLSRELADSRFEERAERCVRFLLSIQLPDGAFPGGELHENRTEPSVFNTCQILSGLAAWSDVAQDGRARDAARRAADWIVAQQDPDGAWRRHAYLGVATTYSAHASCWLADYGKRTGARKYLDSAGRHLDWVLGHRDPVTGWIDLAGFSPDDHQARQAVTHTIAYTLQGILHTSEALGRDDGIAAVRAAALRILRRLELSGWLPGVLDHEWRGRASYACLTGNAQMALIWMQLYQREGDIRLVNAALKAIDLVKQAQPVLFEDPNIRGAIPGSDPLWGRYIYCALPNWAPKFFIDALVAKRRTLAGLEERARRVEPATADVPRELPQMPPAEPSELRVVLYSSNHSQKVPQMVSRWSMWGFKPAAVVFEMRPPPSLFERLLAKIRSSGFKGLLARALVHPLPSPLPGDDPPPGNPVEFCRAREIPWFTVRTVDAPDGLALVASLRPDLAVHAGAGILRAPLLALPRLGTLNAHMGVLPFYRGMNVAEWAMLNGDPVGCSVHLVEPGIDTGPILCVRFVDASRARDITKLRSVVDEAQIALLGEVVRWIATTGSLPPARTQRADEGVQFFRMHAELAAILEGRLERAVTGASAPA